ncbi:hypothetical protein KGB36_gp80 [Shigella phage Sf11 SMD-2017]|uniref:Uncharacterized protein n=1 Tax=Shigella phage Sf11 SMD-2017 TaxID=2282196 RepID=A0A291AXC7_9CAUD|nr:hypothetical protein KGB36_gp80 [Shigella phage Sf11 SMD-2017]ATE85672.1 hypothetical protein Sf11_gp25 [Shigella phage Sf11 SMD-2017]
MIIQQIHNDYWRIADKNNIRIASVSMINEWYVVSLANGGYAGRFKLFDDVISSIKKQR